MEQIVTIIHICTALALIVFILLQQGKGAEAGASFGAGASQTIFGSQGTGSLLTRITAILACTFFITSLILGYLAIHLNKAKSIDELLEIAPQTQPSSGSNTEIQKEREIEKETKSTTGTQSITGTHSTNKAESPTETATQKLPSDNEKGASAKKSNHPLSGKENNDIPKLPESQLPSSSSD